MRSSIPGNMESELKEKIKELHEKLITREADKGQKNTIEWVKNTKKGVDFTYLKYKNHENQGHSNLQ